MCRSDLLTKNLTKSDNVTLKKQHCGQSSRPNTGKGIQHTNMKENIRLEYIRRVKAFLNV